jgi:hypothetical protein
VVLASWFRWSLPSCTWAMSLRSLEDISSGGRMLVWFRLSKSYCCIPTYILHLSMYIHTYIYIYICIYVCIYIFIHTYTYIYINIYIYMYTYAYMYAYIYTYIYIYIYIIYIYTGTYRYILWMIIPVHALWVSWVAFGWSMAPWRRWRFQQNLWDNNPIFMG